MKIILIILALFSHTAFGQVQIRNNNPSMPSAQVNADWSSGSGASQILNKPTIPTQYGLPITYFTPTTGTTITSITGTNIVEPSGTLLALTVNLPSSPIDGDIVNITFTTVITGLTISNGTIVNNLTTAAAGQSQAFIFRSANSKWYRF